MERDGRLSTQELFLAVGHGLSVAGETATGDPLWKQLSGYEDLGALKAYLPL